MFQGDKRTTPLLNNPRPAPGRVGSSRKVLMCFVFIIRESFRESEEGVRLPRETADLRGSPGNLRGSPGNFRGSLGNFRGTFGLLFGSTVRELPGKSPKTSGEVQGTSGEVRGLSRSSGEPDSLPVTRQICLQYNLLACSLTTTCQMTGTAYPVVCGIA